jgi:plasmid stability protein
MTIRNLDDEVRDKLRIRAAQHGRSMEAEVRAILAEAVNSPVERTLGNLLHDLSQVGLDDEFELPERVRYAPARDPFA